MDITTATPEELEQLLAQYAHDRYNAHLYYVSAREDYEILKDYKDAVFAKIAHSKIASSNAEKERQALLDDDWSRWLSGLGEARRKAREAEAHYLNYERLWDTCKSTLYSRSMSKRTGV